MILDADLTMPPSNAEILAGAGQRQGGGSHGSASSIPSRRVDGVFLTSRQSVFSLLFTLAAQQRFTDTLCGTKAISATPIGGWRPTAASSATSIPRRFSI